VGRTTALVLIAVLAAVLATSATASTVPRGELTQIEYRELLTVQTAEKSPPSGPNLTQAADRKCRALTRATRLTTAQHTECVAGLIFTIDFYAYTPALARCAKASSLPCLAHATATVYGVTRNFINANVVSVRVAKARGITGACLDYLVFTTQQARVMGALAPGLRGFEHAIQLGRPAAVATDLKQLGVDIRATAKAFDVNESVTSCRHQ